MEWLLDRFGTCPERAAFIHDDRVVSYRDVLAEISSFTKTISDLGIKPGEKVVILCDYSPEVFCLIFALALNRSIVIPLTYDSVVEKDVALGVSGCDWFAEWRSDSRNVAFSRRPISVANKLLDDFVELGQAGLVLFSSGSTGKPKGILHSFDRVAEKFRAQRAPTIGIPFLLIDHFGGINTILALTSSLGTVVTVADRSIAQVCRAIERYRVELLPVTPSFLNLLLVSKVYRDYDLSSLKRITYGTEVMSQDILDRLCTVFPGVKLQQTYGLSELGVLHSQSRADGSLWVRIGGDGFAMQVREGILWIKSQYSMIGYLNAESGFDADGWFNTQDRVEIDGEYILIRGRDTDLINVAGQKVYPIEVEEVVRTCPNVEDAAVYGEGHPLLGSIVVAKVKLLQQEAPEEVKKRVRAVCREKLSSFKVPTKVLISETDLTSSRQKKIRRGAAT